MPAKGGKDSDRASQGFVDYDRVAARYQEGRALPVEVLERWRTAVRPFLPAPLGRLVDIGAGTGIFAREWPRWAATQVIAIEPSASMIGVGKAADSRVCYVQGAAEALSFRDASIDVAWVSTALHHFFDVHRALRELRRVLRFGGRVLVRTYAPDRTEVTWAHEFPGRVKWEARFQPTGQLVALFAEHGFDVLAIDEVLEWTELYEASARWVSHMRDADSMLTALTDKEVEEGLERLRADPAREGRVEMTLFVFEKR